MRPSSLTAFTIIIMVFLTACGGEPEEQAETTPEPTTPAEQTAATDNQPAADGEQKPPEDPSSAEFNNPMEPGNDPTSIGNLLTATNPEQRQEQVKQNISQDRGNRDNPFGAPTVGTGAPTATDFNVQNSDTVEQATQNLTPQQVPDLPELPLLALAPPPSPPQRPGGQQLPQRPGGQQLPQRPGGQQLPQRPGGQQLPQRPGGQQLPQRPGGQQSNNIPGTQQRQQGGGGTRAGGGTSGGGGGTSGGGGTGGTRAGGGTSGGGGGTGSNARGPKNGQKPSIPPLQARGVPDLPALPEKIGPEKLPPAPKSPPVAQIPTTAQTPRGVPDLPELPTPIGPAQLPPAPVAQAPQSPPVPTPPPLPDTQLADGIEVTGVIEVGNQIQVIAKAPNEATSRYIKVGQKIANGQVVVKRVEKEGGEPVVIFEQNGVEVRKLVGEKVAIATDQPK